jgi:hypothetical protein
MTILRLGSLAQDLRSLGMTTSPSRAPDGAHVTRA